LSWVAYEILTLSEKCVLAYLNDSLNNDEYMRIPEGFNLCEAYKSNYWRDDLRNMNKSPYILEQ
jgi:hypothetical protein